MADLSVIIPVYNAQTYLPQCCEAIISQPGFARAEVILVDDGSADDSSGICDRLAETYENIVVIHQKNQGVSAARNAGVRRASSPYVTFCDADDYYLDGILQSILRVIDEQQPSLIFWNYRYEQPTGTFDTSFPFDGAALLPEQVMRRELPMFMLRDLTLNNVWNKAFRKSVIDSIDLQFTPGKKYGEDREFVLRYLAACESGRFLAQTGYFYRCTQTGAIHTNRTNFYENIYSDYTLNLSLYKAFDFSPAEIESMCAQALPAQIIADVFYSYSVCGREDFLTALAFLFQNETMMRALADYLRRGEFPNPSYRKVADFLVRKQTASLRRYLGTLRRKERLYHFFKR